VTQKGTGKPCEAEGSPETRLPPQSARWRVVALVVALHEATTRQAPADRLAKGLASLEDARRTARRSGVGWGAPNAQELADFAAQSRAWLDRTTDPQAREDYAALLAAARTLQWQAAQRESLRRLYSARHALRSA
jgi:hypothetical protein